MQTSDLHSAIVMLTTDKPVVSNIYLFECNVRSQLHLDGWNLPFIIQHKLRAYYLLHHSYLF